MRLLSELGSIVFERHLLEESNNRFLINDEQNRIATRYMIRFSKGFHTAQYITYAKARYTVVRKRRHYRNNADMDIKVNWLQ